ncbi:MAG: Rieske 2Fe-2S domain-containing protein [Acidobacteriota bacterium]|nr:Rieske 2Fe-2S domain-containing protein [Acidobacteriota bacterium]
MPNFVKVANTSDLKPGSAMTVVVNGIDIALYNVGGKIFATDNTCVHQGGPLGEGILDGEVISCPWHMWEYNVCTGEHVQNKSIKLSTYPVEVEGADIKVGV